MIRKHMRTVRKGKISNKEKRQHEKSRHSLFLCVLTLSYDCSVKAIGREK